AVTLLIGIVVVVLPTLAVIFAFVQEGTQLYNQMEAEELDPAALIERIATNLPVIPDLLQRVGINTVNIRETISQSAVTVSQWLAQQALNFGRNTFTFIIRLMLMLYLTFFLLR